MGDDFERSQRRLRINNILIVTIAVVFILILVLFFSKDFFEKSLNDGSISSVDSVPVFTKVDMRNAVIEEKNFIDSSDGSFHFSEGRSLIYDLGYVSSDGKNWKTIDFLGDNYNDWIAEDVSFSSSEDYAYLAFFSCKKTLFSWNCPDEWEIVKIGEVSVDSTIVDEFSEKAKERESLVDKYSGNNNIFVNLKDKIFSNSSDNVSYEEESSSSGSSSGGSGSSDDSSDDSIDDDSLDDSIDNSSNDSIDNSSNDSIDDDFSDEEDDPIVLPGEDEVDEEVPSFDPPTGVGSFGVVKGITTSGFDTALDFLIYNDYLLGATYNGLYVMDLADPLSPEIVETVSYAGEEMALKYPYLYMVSSETLTILDITNILDIKLVSQVSSPVSGSGMDSVGINGNYLFVGGDADIDGVDQFFIYDVSNPYSPQKLNLNYGALKGEQALGYYFYGDYLYLASSRTNDNDAMKVVDISNINSPVLTYDTSYSKAYSVRAMDGDGKYIYAGIYAPTYETLVVYEADLVGGLDLLTTVYLYDRPSDVVAYDNYVFASTYGYETPYFYVVDKTNPKYSMKLANLTSGNFKAYSIAPYQDYVYLSGYGDGDDIKIIDISKFIWNDEVDPLVEVYDPISNSVLSGSVPVRAVASDDVRVLSVRFKLNGQYVTDEIFVDSNSPYEAYLDTTEYSDGSYSLVAEAKDTSGNVKDSSSVSVVIDNANGDKILPEVGLTLPEPTEIFSHYILLAAEAHDNFGISNVKFYVDGNLAGYSDSTSPYKVPFDTSLLNDGIHSVYAVATDASGNTKSTSSISFSVDNSEKWSNNFVPLRTFYVSSNGNDNGLSRTSPMSVSSAISNARAGDLYYFLGGFYNGKLTLANSGTASNPIVYRAYPGEHAQIHGGVSIEGSYIWVWGFEIEDEVDFDSACLGFYNRGQRAINNVMHSCHGMNSFRDGIGSIAYGNIIYEGMKSTIEQRGHNIYTQNKYDEDGRKYYIANMILEAPDAGCNLQFDESGNVVDSNHCYGLHVYTESSYISGFWIQDNIFAYEDAIIGGYNAPVERNVIVDNYFYEATPVFGYWRPSQVEFTGNYLGDSTLKAQRVWGEGEVRYLQKAPNVYLGNRIQSSNSYDEIYLMTSAYLEEGRNEGGPELQESDVFDYNYYHGKLWATGQVGSSTLSVGSLPNFRSFTKSHGNEYDVHSSVLAREDLRIALIPNEYEEGRANLAIYNWNSVSIVGVDLSSVLSNGDSFKIVKSRDVFGTPVVSGTYNGGFVSVPMSGESFATFVVIRT